MLPLVKKRNGAFSIMFDVFVLRTEVCRTWSEIELEYGDPESQVGRFQRCPFVLQKIRRSQIGCHLRNFESHSASWMEATVPEELCKRRSRRRYCRQTLEADIYNNLWRRWNFYIRSQESNFSRKWQKSARRPTNLIADDDYEMAYFQSLKLETLKCSLLFVRRRIYVDGN